MEAKKLLVVAALVVGTLCLPLPDEGAYRIPHVGTRRRSQYYVRHRDGTYKYGHDTGDGAFERARSSRVGQQRGAFGYVDPAGRPVNLQYDADEAGFVPQGTHLPATHPDFETAHALARRRGPFSDPLANPNADPSYGYTFQGEGLARSELTDATGIVRGSYSYVDEEGRTRSYTYKAGSGIGFVIEGDDLPQAETDGSTPAATKLASSTFHFPSVVNRHLSQTGPVRVQTYSALPSPQPRNRPVEVANVRSSLSPDGRQSFDFQTSSHSRGEQQDASNNVEGSFVFTADDGQRRNVQYKASAETGFVVEGDHLPRGPAVPGAPSGIPTGNIVPVRETPFFDPLANSGTDASYNFNFQEDGHSRTEVSDADGTVRGSYSYVDDEGRTRTLRYRAGKGIGFVVEGDGVPVIEGAIPSGVQTYSSSEISSLGDSQLISGQAVAVEPTISLELSSSDSPTSTSAVVSGSQFHVNQYDADDIPQEVEGTLVIEGTDASSDTQIDSSQPGASVAVASPLAFTIVSSGEVILEDSATISSAELTSTESHGTTSVSGPEFQVSQYDADDSIPLLSESVSASGFHSDFSSVASPLDLAEVSSLQSDEKDFHSSSEIRTAESLGSKFDFASGSSASPFALTEVLSTQINAEHSTSSSEQSSAETPGSTLVSSSEFQISQYNVNDNANEFDGVPLTEESAAPSGFHTGGLATYSYSPEFQLHQYVAHENEDKFGYVLTFDS